MTIHTVVQGECLSSIAVDYGFAAADWKTIYEHPENADLRAKRPNPDLIFPGDQVYVPTSEGEAPPARTVEVETGRRHTFQVTRPTTALRVYLKDKNGAAYSLREYTLELPGEPTRKGVTDADGLVEEQIPVAAGEATLKAKLQGGDERVWSLALGHLDPVEETSGVQARLNNLAFDAGPVDGLWGPKTEAGVKAFQAAHGLAVDGIVGPNTRAKLVLAYGC